MKQRERLAAYAVEYGGQWSAIAEAIRTRQPVQQTEIKDPYITLYDAEYPDALRQLRFPPWVLFYEGNLDLLAQPAVTVVGSRAMSRYGCIATEAIVDQLSSSYVIVSGLAKGVDACAHTRCIARGGKTIGVIGCGLGTHYPACNERLYRRMALDQLILSEYPRSTGVRKEHFPWRNRILATLGQSVFVTQATFKSGTMGTVNEAIALSKDVYCVPYPYNDPCGKGCNYLIEQGANILYDLEQLEDLFSKQIPRKVLQKNEGTIILGTDY